MRAHIFAGLLTGIALLLAAGCGATNERADESDSEAEAKRFATADALVEYYNEIAMNGPKVDWHPILNRVYTETPEHERIIDVVYAMLALSEYHSALWEQFESVREDLDERPLAPDKHPAKIIERSGRRVTAEQVQNDGSKMKIHLVKMNGEWWISAYTFEYDQHYQSMFEQIGVPDSEEFSYKANAEVVRRMARRVRNGAFDSPSQANQALFEAISNQAPGR